MKFIFAGRTSSANFSAGATVTGFLQADDGSPVDWASVGTLRTLLFTASSGLPLIATVTPHGTRGVYGEFTCVIPAVVVGTTYTVTLRVATSGGGAGELSSVTLTSGGAGYRGLPTATVVASTGSGAVLTPTITPVSLTSPQITAPGSGFTDTPSVTFSGGGFTTSAAATATLAASIASVTTNTPALLVAPPVLTLYGGSGSGAVLTPTLRYTLGGIQITNAGTGYISVPTVTITGGGGSFATAVAVLSNTEVAQIYITNPGMEFTSAPTVTITGGGGSGATATAFIAAGANYQSSSLSSPSVPADALFPTAPILTAGAGLVCTVTATVNRGILAAVALSGITAAAGTYSLSLECGGVTVAWTVTIGGSNNVTGTTFTPTACWATAGNYINPNISAPDISSEWEVTHYSFNINTSNAVTAISVTGLNQVSAGYGSSYTGTANLTLKGRGTSFSSGVSLSYSSARLTAITVSSAGSGYSPNTANSTGTTLNLGGSGVMSAGSYGVVTNNYVSNLSLTNAGAGYTSAPTVSIIGGGGTGATASATLNSTTVSGISISSPGTGYSADAAVVFSGGTPTTTASASVVVNSGTLATITNTVTGTAK